MTKLLREKDSIDFVKPVAGDIPSVSGCESTPYMVDCAQLVTEIKDVAKLLSDLNSSLAESYHSVKLDNATLSKFAKELNSSIREAMEHNYTFSLDSKSFKALNSAYEDATRQYRDAFRVTAIQYAELLGQHLSKEKELLAVHEKAVKELLEHERINCWIVSRGTGWVLIAVLILLVMFFGATLVLNATTIHSKELSTTVLINIGTFLFILVVAYRSSIRKA
jgi:regulator of replication initiation timing